MADNIASTAGVVGVQQPIQSAPASSSASDLLAIASTGMSLFAMNQKNAQANAKAQADSLKVQQSTDASNAAANFISEVQQVKAMKGGLAAQSFASQKFAELQGSLDAGTREIFVDNVKKGLGFNPIESSTNRLIKEEEAARAKEAQDRDTATSIYLSTVNLGDPEAVQTAASNVQNMSQDQIAFILNINEAEDLKVEKELKQHQLAQERASTEDVKRNRAQRLATTAVSSGFNKLVAGYQVRLEQAVASGDVNAIMSVQQEGLSSLAAIEAGLQAEATSVLSNLGVQDVDLTTINAQLVPVRNQIASLRKMFQMTDLQNASEAATKYMFTTALNRTAREDTQVGQVATAILSDQLYGTRFGQNYVEKMATKGILHNALTYNNIETTDEKAAVKNLENTITQGSVFAVQELDPTTPNLPEMVAELTSGQIAALEVGVAKEPEVKSQLAVGVVQNWEAAAFGQSTNAIRSKVFEPTLKFFADPKNAAAYKGDLAGTEDTFLAASTEYIKGNVMPALTQAIGLSSQDLSTKFTVEVQGGKFRLMPKVVGEGLGLSEFSAGGQAAKVANSQRRVVAQAARKTEALYNQIILTYSNLYGVNLDTALEVFAEQYAQGLGVKLIEVKSEE